MAIKPIRIELTPESKKLIAKISLQGGARKELLYNQILALFATSALRIASSISRDFLSGQALLRRTGRLAGSITGDASLFGKMPSFRVGVIRGPALQYAGIQEEGTSDIEPESPYAPIKPKASKYLAMPRGKALTPAGVPRYVSPRDYPGELRFIPYAGGKIAVGALYDLKQLDQLRRKSASSRRRTKGKGESKERGGFSLRNIIPVYVLLKQASIRGHHFLRDGMQQGLGRVAADLEALLASFIAGTSKS